MRCRAPDGSRALALAALACAAALAGGVAAAADAPAPRVAEYFRAQAAAFDAVKAKDDARFLAEATRALDANPYHAPARYLRAAALLANGRADAALAELERLADAGLALGAAREPMFATLADDTRFRALAARFEANGKPSGAARVDLEISGLPGDFVPEGFQWDARHSEIVLGSVRQRRIVRVHSSGQVRELVPAAGDGLMSVLGLHVLGDEVVVASAGLPQMRPLDPTLNGRSALFAFALADGTLRRRYDVPATPGRESAVGDFLALSPRTLLATDSAAGRVLSLDRPSGRWVDAAPPGLLGSPQGLARLDPWRVVVADYSSGLWVLSLKGRPPVYLRPQGADALHGIDGLYAWKDRLIAIQNGTRPQRILRIAVDLDGATVERVEVLAANLPEWDEPTLGQVIGDTFYYVANSHWPRFDANGELPAAKSLTVPRIMKLGLD
jgi:hypothetical protein